MHISKPCSINCTSKNIYSALSITDILLQHLIQLPNEAFIKSDNFTNLIESTKTAAL
jgi:hypothetical protein